MPPDEPHPVDTAALRSGGVRRSLGEQPGQSWRGGGLSYESAIDRAIREATERGEFDNLPGAGKPLHLRNTGDPNWWLKDLMEREAISPVELLSPAVALRREADGFPSRCATCRTSRRCARCSPTSTAASRPTGGVRLGRGEVVVAKRVDVDAVVAAWHELRRTDRA